MIVSALQLGVNMNIIVFPMPKKTKKEKILADSRRKSNVSFSLSLPQKKEISKSGDFAFSLPVVDKEMHSARHQAPNKSYSYVYKDLVKIIFFTLLAMIAQFVLVWFLRTK